MDGRIVNISEGVSLALHSLKMIVSYDTTLTTEKIAKSLKFSSNHLSKVLRRLVVANLLSVSKGPGGGFYITPAQKKRKIIEVYRTFEGEPSTRDCLYEEPACDYKKCVFGNLICKANKEFLEHFNKTSIEDLYSQPSVSLEDLK